MAIIPQPKNIRGASAGMMVNAIINSDESGYLVGAPLVNETTQSFRQVGQYILANQNRRNAFISTLMNKVAFTVLRTLTFYDKWSQFTEKGIIEDGETIEEIYIGLCEAENYEWTTDINETMKALYGKRKNEVSSAFHPINWQKRYVKTISLAEIRKAFRSESMWKPFIDELINSMYKSYAYDNYIITKYMFYRLALDGFIYAIKVPESTKENAEDIMIEVTAALEDAEYIRERYTMANVEMNMEKSRAIVLKSLRFGAIVDITVLANAFNMQKAEFSARQIPIDGFSESELRRLDKLLKDDPSYKTFTQDELAAINNIVCAVVDESFFMNYMYLYELKMGENEAELYYNWFLHIWKVYSVSPFKDAMVFTTETQSVKKVTIVPATASAYPGNILSFAADVDTTGFTSHKGTWTIEGANSKATIIDVNGNVQVGKDETATSITVKFTSTYDASKSGTATLTISK